MSNQQIGTVIGMAVGFFVPVVGVALGGAIGGVVGSLLTEGPKTEGPRLDDLKVSFSTYGVGLPLLYGTERLGGNCVWSTDKLEIATTEGGKGGGPEHTSYRYYVHQRYVLCETPRDGSIVNVVRIFVDGKLQWDARSGIPLGSALASAENLFTAGTLWQGDENQLPDGNEEPWEGGPGSVAAYRGVVSYSVIALECPGGRIPQLSFVVSTSSTVGALVTQQIESTPSASSTGAIITPNGVWEYTASQNGAVFDMPFSFGYLGELQPVGTVSFPIGGSTPYPIAGTPSAQVMVPYPNTGELFIIDLEAGTMVLLVEGDPLGPGTLFGRAAYDPTVNLYVVSNWDSTTTGNEPVIMQFAGPNITCEPIAGDGHGGVVGFHNGTVHVVTTDGVMLLYSRRNSAGMEESSMPITIGPAVSFSPRWSALYVSDEGVYLYAVPATPGGEAKIYKITPATIASPGEFKLLCEDTGTSTETLFGTASKTFYCTNDLATVGPIVTGSETGYNAIRFVAVTTDDVKVSDIITDLCERIGETRFDVSEIPDSDTVFGYKIASVASARANIDPLLTAFGIYVVDEDGLIKFKKRSDLVSVATVSYDELGQAEDGAEPGDPMPLNHTQEIDLPRSATVSYIEPNFDFQVASEPYYREVTDSIEDLIIDLPIALTSSNQAKQVAQWAVYERALAQNTRTCKLSRKYAFVSPGGGLTIEYPRGTSRLWFVASTTDTGALCEFNLQPGDAQLLTHTAVGATGYPSQDVSPLAPPTRMVLLDSPIMRDVDNNPGLYVAAEGFSAGWRGYTLYVGDDDTDLQDRGTVTTSVPIGFAESALGDWTPNMLDGMNSVILSMGEDELNSTTEPLLMTTRVNLALIGADGRWEAIQFMTASDLGSGRYLIYGLLRGLYGTERFRSTHEVGDKFVLMTVAGMLRPNQDAGSLGQTKSYRPVSLGRSRDSVASTTFANTGIGLLPYSPWDARKSKAASNDQTITWERRSRLSTNALRGTVPLGEATESYSVEFYTASDFATLAGTLTSTTKSLTITSAQQTAFGLTPGATLYVHIRQVSDIVGAGAPLEATL